jgi:hypothetical protein
MASPQANSILFYKAPALPSIPSYIEAGSSNQLRTLSRIMTEAEFAALMIVTPYTDSTIHIDVGDIIITTGALMFRHGQSMDLSVLF